MTFMLFVYVVILPASALRAGWRNRQGGRTRAELAEKDGALTALTRRYAPQSRARAGIRRSKRVEASLPRVEAPTLG